jgi:hypothetical protein
MDGRLSAPEDVRLFGRHIAAVLGSLLSDAFVGAYFVGSIALGGYVAGESDVDIIALCRHTLRKEAKQTLAEQVLEATTTCPTRGLEFTLYRTDVASSSPVHADFEVNVNGGPWMTRTVQPVADDEPAFWYVLDRAIAHRCGVAIVGPPARTMFADVPRDILLAAMADSMRWHREHEKATLYSVLNACRAWRFAVEDVLGSKLEGAGWARERWGKPALIDAAVDLRHGRAGHLDVAEVDAYLAHVERVLSGGG